MTRPSGINSWAGYSNVQRDWRTAAQEIQEARKELEKHANIMTPYERQSFSEIIKERVTRDYSMIYQGVKDQLQTTAKKYQDKQAAIESAHSRLAKSWDNAKLGAEMNAFQMLVNHALQGNSGVPGLSQGTDSVGRLKAIYQEARRTGDTHKMRAAAEVLRSINTDSLPKDTAFPLRMLAKQAEADLSEMQTPPELPKLQEEFEAVRQELTEDLQEVATAADIVGEPIDRVFAGGNFGKLFKTVQLDRKTGALKIYEENDPEVTGIRFQAEDNDHSMIVGG